MKKDIYAVGAFALALSMSVLPAAALAKEAESGTGSVGVSGQSGKTVQVQTTIATTSNSQVRIEDNSTVSARGSDSVGTSSNRGSDDSATAASQGEDRVATSSNRGENETVTENLNDNNGFHLELESEYATSSAHSLSELRQKMESRKAELDNEVASTTQDNRDVLENANRSRLAVASFLASENLLGASGAQIAEHARELNASISTTTNAEAEIHSRGFFAHFFFGGDSSAAEVLAKAVAENQTHIDQLTTLLNSATVSADVKAVLTAQITVLQDSQARLKALAEKERTEWGLLSWRF